MSVGSHLRSIRESRGLTIKQVVNMSGDLLDKTTISRIERDERGLSIKAVYALASVYNIELKDVCELYIGKKLKISHVPFDVTPEEQRLITLYRQMSRGRQRSLQEIARGLCLARPPEPASETKRKLANALRNIDQEEENYE